MLILNQVDLPNTALYTILPFIMSLFIWFPLFRVPYLSISQFLIYTPTSHSRFICNNCFYRVDDSYFLGTAHFIDVSCVVSFLMLTIKNPFFLLTTVIQDRMLGIQSIYGKWLNKLKIKVFCLINRQNNFDVSHCLNFSDNMKLTSLHQPCKE